MLPEPYSHRIEKPWGHEVVLTPPDLARAGKLLYVTAGRKLSLQYHDEKEETIALIRGEALLHFGNTREQVRPYAMQPLRGYLIRPGDVHRLEAVTDAVFFEVSSPETGTTFRLQDDYARDDERR